VPEINHVAGEWCKYCDIGKGCSIYEIRPDVCVNFECLWLNSHSEGEGMQIEMRPDKCKVVFSPTTKENIISGTTLPNYPDAWRKGPARYIIDKLIEAGVTVVIGGPNTLIKTVINKGGEQKVEMSEPDENGIQWNKGSFYG